LYTLLQLPGTAAHALLGTLDESLRARLVVESWHAAQDRHFGISLEHIRYAARRAAVEICQHSTIDSRHALLVCLAGAFASGPEFRAAPYESVHILGRSNLAVGAMEDVGIDALRFLDKIREPALPMTSTVAPFPSF
jgi:hypothetical protein